MCLWGHPGTASPCTDHQRMGKIWGTYWWEGRGAGWAPSLHPSPEPRWSQKQCKLYHHLQLNFGCSPCLSPQDKDLSNKLLSTLHYLNERRRGGCWIFGRDFPGSSTCCSTHKDPSSQEALAPSAALCRAALQMGSKSDALGGLQIYCAVKAICSVHTWYVRCVPDTHVQLICLESPFLWNFGGCSERNLVRFAAPGELLNIWKFGMDGQS